MPQLTVHLSPGEYAQLQAFTAALKREARPEHAPACTIESLASQMLASALETQRRWWYARQAAGIAEDNLDVEALSALNAARCLP